MRMCCAKKYHSLLRNKPMNYYSVCCYSGARSPSTRPKGFKSLIDLEWEIA